LKASEVHRKAIKPGKNISVVELKIKKAQNLAVLA